LQKHNGSAFTQSKIRALKPGGLSVLKNQDVNTIETQRLLLRRLCEEDAAFILELMNTPGWLRFIGDRGIRTSGDAREYILNGPVKSYENHGFGLLLVELKESGRPAGMCGLLKRDELDMPDLGFAFLPAENGKGYAAEAAAAVLEHARNTLRLTRIAAITATDNEKSVRLLQGRGFCMEKSIQIGEEQLLLFLLEGNNAATEDTAAP
jgi:RimJ/RimL family protein N-acetyltransferase